MTEIKRERLAKISKKVLKSMVSLAKQGFHAKNLMIFKLVDDAYDKFCGKKL